MCQEEGLLGPLGARAPSARTLALDLVPFAVRSLARVVHPEVHPVFGCYPRPVLRHSVRASALDRETRNASGRGLWAPSARTAENAMLYWRLGKESLIKYPAEESLTAIWKCRGRRASSLGI